MARESFMRPYSARPYRSIEMMRRSVENTQTERHVSAPKGAHRTARYTAYKELSDHTGALPYIVCSGATQLIGAASGGGNRVGIAAQDHLCNTETQFYTRGLFDVPFNPADATQTGLLGQAAYYVPETGYFTADATGLGTDRIKVGVFQSNAILAVDKSKYPNGIMWVRVELLQTFDNATLAPPADANGCLCDNDGCELFAAPVATHNSGLTVDFAANAVSGNPAQSIGTYNWNFDGTVTSSGGVVSFATQSTDANPSYTFPSAGTYTDVYLIISAQLEDGSCGCNENQTVGENPCCKVYQITVEVTATTAVIVSCNTVNNSTLRTFNTFNSYRKTSVAVIDTVSDLLFDVSAMQAAVGDITTAGASALGTAIEAAITLAGFVFGNVIVNVTEALADGEAQSLNVTVTATNADLRALKITINGGSLIADFVVI